MKRIQLAIMAVALVIAVQAHASIVFDFSYSDPLGNIATGQLTANTIGGNQYLALSGNINLSSSSNPGLNDTYSLLAGGPGGTFSPSGAFIYDNVLSYPGDPIVDNAGLLFQNSSLSVELNLYSNADGTYALYAWDATDGYVTLYDGLINAGSATASLTPVPEASTMIAGALLLLPFGASTLRILRRKQTA